ncbi:MAG: alginate export family protein [Bacteroidales bacterium]|nr:alginate export family protein [Bacteroidales bacterium]
MKVKIKLLIVVFLAIAASAKSQVVIDGEIRPRAEFNDGVKTLLSKDQSAAMVTSQRSRLNLSYQDDRISSRISVQDVRVWGEAEPRKDLNSINLFEAWAGFKMNDAFSMRLGRQVFKYDDNRILGISNWNNIATSHDLALFMYSKNSNKLHLGLAYNNDKDKKYESNYPVNFYKYLGTLWYNRQWTNSLSTSVLNVLDGNQPEGSDHTVYNRYTSGVYLTYNNDSSASSFSAAAYYQYGKLESGMKVSAYFASFNYSYSWSGNFNTWIGADYFSGDDAFEADNTSSAFSKLQGDSHGFYGYMDYFGTIEKDTKGGGLTDLFIGMEHKLSKKVSHELTLHHFRLNNNIIDTISSTGETLKADRNLGVEIDYMLKYKPTTNLELRAGYSTMLAAPSMEILKGGDPDRYQQWAWVMLTFKPVFFKKQ